MVSPPLQAVEDCVKPYLKRPGVPWKTAEPGPKLLLFLYVPTNTSQLSQSSWINLIYIFYQFLFTRVAWNPHAACIWLLQARHGVWISRGGWQALHSVLPQCIRPLLHRLSQQDPRPVAEGCVASPGGTAQTVLVPDLKTSLWVSSSLYVLKWLKYLLYAVRNYFCSGMAKFLTLCKQ